MRKFLILLKKEISEMITLQTLIPMIISVLLFMFMGQFFSDISQSSQLTSTSFVVVDQDQSQLSSSLLEYVKARGMDYTLITPADTDQYDDYLYIPAGFEQSVLAGQPAQIELHNELKTLSLVSSMKARPSSSAVQLMSRHLSEMLYQQSGSNYSYDFITQPIATREITHLKGRSAEVAPEVLSAMTMQQSILLPIIVFLLAMFGSQMVASATANEKINKTLETLLTTPVSRLSVLAAKMLSAALVSLLMAGIYMFGLSNYMGGMMGGAAASTGTAQNVGGVMAALGLQITPIGYFWLGLNLFMTLLICLCISTALGSLATDVKSAQTIIMPIMITLMIPYMASVFTDIATLNPLPRYILYAIPFTHTFMASINIMLGRYTLLAAGLLYQAAFLAVCLILTSRLFSSDKLFTMKFSLGRKRSRSKRFVA